jgi:hypothetical protein
MPKHAEFLVLIAALSMLVPQAWTSECDSVLIVDSLNASSSDELAILRVLAIDRDTYRTLQEKGNSGLKIPIDGFPIDFSSSYDNFQQTQQRIRERYNVSVDDKHSRSLLVTHLGTDAINAWSQCMARGKNIHVKIIRVTPNRVTFSI